METAQYLIQYKNLKQKAINLGLTKENYGDYLNYLDVLEGMLQASVYNLRSLTGDYINLSRLEEDTKLASGLDIQQSKRVPFIPCPVSSAIKRPFSFNGSSVHPCA
jgi:hypothetical protein